MDWLPEPSWWHVFFAYIAGIATPCMLPFVWFWLVRRYVNLREDGHGR